MGTVKITVDTVNGHTDFLAVRGGRGDPNYIGSKYLLLCVIMLLFPFEDPNMPFKQNHILHEVGLWTCMCVLFVIRSHILIFSSQR